MNQSFETLQPHWRYGTLELVEGFGLSLDELLAEYLTVIATSLLIPLKLYETRDRPGLWPRSSAARSPR